MVRELARTVDPDAYDPQHVCIGPYHRRKSPNVARYNDKMASLDAILSAAIPARTLEAYLAELAADEARARSYYANTFDDMTTGEFLRMLLLDACYVLNCLIYTGDNKLQVLAVQRDVLYLVENQIPYFIIDMVYKLTFSGSPCIDVPASVIIARNLTRYILQKHQYTTATITPAAAAEPGNLLHLVHTHFLKPAAVSVTSLSPTGQQPQAQPVGRWRTAMDYHISGINLKSRPVGAGSTEARSILDVTLDSVSGTLVVPRLRMDGETGRILRNLVALEQHNPGLGSHVTAYCVFMSQMACTASDVGLLSRTGVIVHLLANDDEVAGFFSDLCKGVVFDPDDADHNYLWATCQVLDKLCGSRPRRCMALLYHKYSANPWLVIGVVAASIGLVSNLVQTFYTALSYYRGPL